uniref:Cytochrome b561 domain-containing protein n=1 Tax=Physcomitrium patens TaxID=3218 RepID=A0A2K1L0Y1_PHYPA|nr:hypothetical protein PHYPA_002475 [Physcomitrium patens]
MAMKIVNTPSIVVIVFLMCFVLVASAATPVAGGPPHYPFHWIKVHGWLMCLSMGLLMPVAIILIRFSRGYRESGDLKNVRTLVYVHTIIQVVAVLTVICSAAVAVTKFDNSFTYTHERLGLALWILVWLPPLVGLIRPNHDTRMVQHLHRAACIRSRKSLRTFQILFSIQLRVCALIYLAQDRLQYLVAQGKFTCISSASNGTKQPVGGAEL